MFLCLFFIFIVLCLFLKDYIDAHPETVVLDPLPAIRTLLDRCKSYQLVHRIESRMQGKWSELAEAVTLAALHHAFLFIKGSLFFCELGHKRGSSDPLLSKSRSCLKQ